MKQVHNGYWVDKDGNVYNPKMKKLKPFPFKKLGSDKYNRKPYLLVNLQGKPRILRYVHRLVAENFVPGYFDGAIVDHIDRDTHNNKASNLRWTTVKQNYHNADNVKRAKNISKGLKKYYENLGSVKSTS